MIGKTRYKYLSKLNTSLNGTMCIDSRRHPVTSRRMVSIKSLRGRIIAKFDWVKYVHQNLYEKVDSLRESDVQIINYLRLEI